MIGRRLMFFAKPLQRSNLCASHRQRRWLTHGELARYERVADVSERIEDLSDVPDATRAERCAIRDAARQKNEETPVTPWRDHSPECCGVAVVLLWFYGAGPRSPASGHSSRSEASSDAVVLSWRPPVPAFTNTWRRPRVRRSRRPSSERPCGRFSSSRPA